MAQLALSAIGRDRPGIVAATTAALLRHGANVEDSRMAILRGHFTMMLIVSLPDGADRSALATDLDAVAADLGLEALALSPVEPLAEETAEATHVVTIYGVDHPGIVHRTARVLAEHGANVTDLETRLAEEQGGPPLYVLVVEVALPSDLDPPELEAALRAAGAEESVEVSFRALDRTDL